MDGNLFGNLKASGALLWIFIIIDLFSHRDNMCMKFERTADSNILSIGSSFASNIN